MALKKARVAATKNDLNLVDSSTGEIIGKADKDLKGAFVWVQQKQTYGKDFAVFFQADFARLSKEDVTGTDLKVFLALLAFMDFRNRINCPQRQIAEHVGIARQRVNASMRKLERLGFLERSDNVYYLSLASGWKGEIGDYNRAQRPLKALG